MKGINHILGRLFAGKKKRYWVNIVNTRGTVKYETTSFIHASKSAANKHRRDIESTLTFEFVETVSFKSINNYEPHKISKKQI